MGWFDAPDEELFGASIWTCQTCRLLPATVTAIEKQLSSAQKNISDLVAVLAIQISNNEELRKENNELRKLVNSPGKREAQT